MIRKLAYLASHAALGLVIAGAVWAQTIGPQSSDSGRGIPSTCRTLSSLNTTNATSCKASAGRAYAIQVCSAATYTVYIKLYNKGSAPTVGTDTPVKTLPLKAGACAQWDWPNIGYAFPTGIAYAFTQGVADTDTTALANGDLVGFNLDYN